ncbi:exosortase N [Marinilabiliaceae bacterium JC017]|nr:exosortase N [Marinilabiliaceae bacterium JC017]
MITIKSHRRSLRLLLLYFCFYLMRKLPCLFSNVKLLKETKNGFSNRLRKRQWFGYVIALIIVVAAIPKFNQFGGLRFEQVLFFLVMPFTLTKTGGIYKPTPFFVLAVLFIFGFYLTHVYSLFYFGVCCALLTCLTITDHRPTLLSLGLGLITTPAIKYLLSIFSFPLRLKLTGVAGKLLSFFIQQLHVAGNCIQVKGVAFTVAPECLGLNMIASALVFAVFVLAFFATKYKLRPSLGFVLFFMFVAFGLVVLANLARIILTVIMQAMPGTTLHELIGVFIFVLNCCLPLFVIGAYSKRFYRDQNTAINPLRQKYFLYLLLLPIGVIGSYGVRQNLLETEFDTTSISIDGYNKSESKDGVLKFMNASALVYVKPPAFMLGSDHNPFICWRASGYQIKNEMVRQVGKQSVYTFELYKADEAPLYSCWWYDNGHTHTVSQLQWRLATLRGESPYCLVNVTTSSKEETFAVTSQVLEMDIFE